MRVAGPVYRTSETDFADCVYFGRSGKPLAVNEAKRTSRDQLEGERQAEDYVERIKVELPTLPVIFVANDN